jgi:Histone methylation protein DOT1
VIVDCRQQSLIYGEVEFKSFYRVLRKINPQPGLVFYDLGSGTGKAVFLARLTQDFSKCIGIEVLHSLHNQARKIVDRYNKDYRDRLCVGQNQHASVYAVSDAIIHYSVVFADMYSSRFPSFALSLFIVSYFIIVAH